MVKRVKKYEESLHEALQDPAEAVAYLNAHLEDDEAADTEELFLMALRDVARAHGFSEVAKRAQVGRESLYKTLSRMGNPRLATLASVLRAMGMRLSVQIRPQRSLGGRSSIHR
jgi:probable addiction module antidote protein